MAIDPIKDAPRRQHYYFAHEYLRDRAHSHPAYLINELRQETAFKYLAWHWVARGVEVAEREEDFIAGKGLGVFPVDGVKQPRSGGIY